MKISFTPYIYKPKVNFKGDYWLTTDVHDRMPMYCGTLTELQKQIKNSKEKTTIIDSGDNYGKIFNIPTMEKIVDKFANDNKNVNMVYNLANVELYGLMKEPLVDDTISKEELLEKNKAHLQEKKDYIKMIQDIKKKHPQVKYICAAAHFLEENHGVPKGLIEPYAIIDDIVDGEPKKVLVLGTSVNSDRIAFSLENQKKFLKGAMDELREKGEKYDYAILVSHNFIEFTSGGKKERTFDEIFNYVKEDLGVENLVLTLGGHPHAIYDDEKDGVRRVFPPAQGKGAVKTTLKKDGIHYEKLHIGKSTHDYTSLLENNQNEVIANPDINSPLEMDQYYKALVFSNPIYSNKIMKMPISLSFRDESLPLSETCELGTLIANSARDLAGADFAFFLTMDYREKLPVKDEYLTEYNLKDTINVNKPIYLVKNITPEILRELFEESLRDQTSPENSNFMEFSDNLKIERTKAETGKKIKQIYIKENSGWKPMFDAKGQTLSEFKDRKFSAATCSFVALKEREGLRVIKNINDENKSACIKENNEQLLISDALITGLERIQKEGLNKAPKSEIVTV